MTRAIIVAFHKYQPYGGKYYEPLFDYFIHNLSTVKDEFDAVYFIDSNWDIDPLKISQTLGEKGVIIKVNPHLRYYDAYKEVLPLIQEDLVLFMDNDCVVYKRGIIKKTFDLLEEEENEENKTNEKQDNLGG